MMTFKKIFFIYFILVMYTITIFDGLSGYTFAGLGQFIPDDLIIEDRFKPGFGLPVGKVQLAYGNGIIIHTDQSVGFKVKKGLPLFKGDTVITKQKSRIRLALNDGSILSLSPGTRIVINRSIYDSYKKKRVSFLNLSIGKARFWVTKVLNFKEKRFNIKTATAVIGVRGSDFVVTTSADLTQVTTLKDTLLEVVSMVDPCVDYIDASKCIVKPTLLSSFQRTKIPENEFPTEVETISTEEINQIELEFKFEHKDEIKADEDSKAKFNSGYKADDVHVLIPKDELVEPGEFKEAGEEFKVEKVPEYFNHRHQQEEEGRHLQDEFAEEQNEDIELPNFPSMPE